MMFEVRFFSPTITGYLRIEDEVPVVLADTLREDGRTPLRTSLRRIEPRLAARTVSERGRALNTSNVSPSAKCV